MCKTYAAVDKDGSEKLFNVMPVRDCQQYPELASSWEYPGWYDSSCIELPDGSIRKLIGRDLTWEDEPVNIFQE